MDKGFKILYFSVLVTVIIIFGYFYYTVSSENKELKESFNSNIERIKMEKDSIINSTQIRIDSVNLLNVPLHNKIENLIFELDSIGRVKQSIRIIYIDKLKQIDSFQNEQILNYWKSEFND